MLCILTFPANELYADVEGCPMATEQVAATVLLILTCLITLIYNASGLCGFSSSPEGFARIVIAVAIQGER